MSLSNDLDNMVTKAASLRRQLPELEKQAFLPGLLKSIRSGAGKLFGGLTGHGKAMAQLERSSALEAAQRGVLERFHMDPQNMSTVLRPDLRKLWDKGRGSGLGLDTFGVSGARGWKTDAGASVDMAKAFLEKLKKIHGKMPGTAPSPGDASRYGLGANIRDISKWIESERALEAATKFQNRAQAGGAIGTGGLLGYEALK
jgi:hypothetical protein